MNSKIKKIIQLVILLVVIFLLLSSLLTYYGRQKGTVRLVYTVPTNAQGVSVQFNGEETKPVYGSTYILHSGSYSLAIKKTGYTALKTNFKLKTGQLLSINIVLKPISNSTIVSLNQFNLPSGIQKQETTIENVQYFYNQTWAFVLMDSQLSGPAYFVANYDAAARQWKVIIGPGTSFDQISINGLPSAVQNYMINNDYAG